MRRVRFLGLQSGFFECLRVQDLQCRCPDIPELLLLAAQFVEPKDSLKVLDLRPVYPLCSHPPKKIVLNPEPRKLGLSVVYLSSEVSQCPFDLGWCRSPSGTAV